MSHRTAPRLPLSTPAWLTPSRIAMAAITAFGASAALPAVWWIRLARGEIGNDPNAIRAVAATTAILSLLLARRALRADSVTKAVLWSISGGILAGVLNAGIACGAVQLIRHGDPGGAFANLLAGLFFGGFFGGPIGVIFGLAYSFVIASASRARHDPSHDGPDRTLLTAGIWLTLSGAGLRALVDDCPAPVPPEVLIGLGVPAAGLAIFRIQGRKRWLARVARGLVPAFRIEEPPEGAAVPDNLVPVFRAKQSKSKGILSYFFPEGGSPYREPAASVPLALAELPRSPAEPPSPEGPKHPSQKSARRAPRIKLPDVGLELRAVAMDIFVALAKTLGVSLILLVFAAAIAVPFLACASTLLAPIDIQ